MGGEAGWAPSGGLRSCACSRTGWGRHHHHRSNDLVVVVVVVELPQAPEDDPQKRKSCTWKAVGLVTVGVCVW